MGVLRSTILLPADWREWDDAKLNAVLAHEVSHVARHDALTQRLSLLHRAIFWFSPLAWWLDRHLADLAEQASDEAALSCGADRKDYARTLLGFFEALQTAPGRVWWQGVAMAKAGQAEQRVERILSWKGSVTMDRNTKKIDRHRSCCHSHCPFFTSLPPRIPSARAGRASPDLDGCARAHRLPLPKRLLKRNRRLLLLPPTLSMMASIPADRLLRPCRPRPMMALPVGLPGPALQSLPWNRWRP